MSSLFTYDNISPDRLAPADNILLDYTTKDIPTDIKELFNLIEYLALNSGQVVSAIKKLTEFPITRVVFDHENKSLRERHESFSDTIKYKSHAMEIGFDYNMYGNSIISVYLPFTRMIVCPHCKHKQKLRESRFSYTPKGDQFHLKECKNCGLAGNAKIEDYKDTTLKNINIIRWDLKQIDVEYNTFSGKRYYYYYLSVEEKRKIKENHIDTLCTYPRSFLKLAGKDNKHRFKFSDDYVFHMKAPNLSGISRVWGFPPPTPALKSFFYQFMLRKANEAVALDYMNHLRVIYPAMSQPENNPLQYINMSVWADEMSQTVKKWRQDKNFIKLSPHPLGYQALGGEGRGLLLTNEIREASYDILMTLGIPKELMEGSSAQNMASPVLLRIVENMMLTYMEQLVECLNWIDGKVSRHMNVEAIDVDFVPFKFIDDIQRKQLLINWGQGGQNKKVSDTTIADQLDIDLDNEQDKIVEDTIREYKLNKQITDKIDSLENSLANQADLAAAQAGGQAQDYNNQQQTIAQADGIAQQMLQVPYEERKSHLLQLQKEDFVMYSVVIQRMEELNRSMKQNAVDAAKMASENESIKDFVKKQRQIKIAKLIKETTRNQYQKGLFELNKTGDEDADAK